MAAPGGVDERPLDFEPAAVVADLRLELLEAGVHGHRRDARSSMIGEQHLQPYGIVHGGVHTGIIEAACSTRPFPERWPGGGEIAAGGRGGARRAR